MASFADLHRSIQATLASKRLGKPVFVRLTWQGLEKPQHIIDRLTEGVSATQQWLGQPLERIHANGTLETGQVSLALTFREGATALLSYSQGKARGDGIDLLILGNHGAIYHDAGSADLWDKPASDLPAEPDPRTVAWIERAIRSHQPEQSTAGSKP